MCIKLFLNRLEEFYRILVWRMPIKKFHVVQKRVLIYDLVIVYTLVPESFMMLLVIQVDVLPARETYRRFLISLAEATDELFIRFGAEHYTKSLISLGFGNLFDVFLLVNLLGTGDGGEIFI